MVTEKLLTFCVRYQTIIIFKMSLTGIYMTKCNCLWLIWHSPPWTAQQIHFD